MIPEAADGRTSIEGWEKTAALVGGLKLEALHRWHFILAFRLWRSERYARRRAEKLRGEARDFGRMWGAGEVPHVG